jgi:outer membrane receptor protein involved in Fe transport
MLLTALAAMAPALAHAGAPAPSAVGEVIVTAQRRTQDIQDVPISITSYDTARMDRLGVRQIDDLSRLTPSLRFVRTAGVAGNNGANISIRGVASDVGAATTAVYIDDTPIQIRNVSYFGGNPYPRIFDIERVEVLRGPQGTLFGAGAEGGAVRFITPQPQQGPAQVYVRAEGSTTRNGAASGELGVAAGGGLGETLALRASAWARHDGGYVDRIVPQTTTVAQKDINHQDTRSARLAITWTPAAALSVTPSIYHQQLRLGGRDQYWEDQSAVARSDYVAGPTTPEPEKDDFTLSALRVQYQLTANVQLISNTSYFQRRNEKVLNYIYFQSFLRSGSEFGSFGNKDPTNSSAYLHTGQKNLTQEIRLQSYAPGQRFDWTAGIYVSRTRQDFENLTQSGRLPGVLSGGFPQYLGRYNLLEIVRADDNQTAGFASLDWKLGDRLKLTAAARLTSTRLTFGDLRDGPVNSGQRTLTEARKTDTAFTPKLGAQYEVAAHHMIYASASKGFRPGGGQLPVDPGFCGADLATLGLKTSPMAFAADSLWSYEAGSRNSWADGRVLLDANAYYVKWKNIQQAIRLPTCSFSYVDNLGSATGKGMDLKVALKAADWLTVGLDVGYNHTSFDGTILGGAGLVLRTAGERIGGPAWTGSAYAEASWPIGDAAQAYARADYSFQSQGVVADPKDFGFDPDLPALRSNDYLALRAGITFAGYDLSAFVNNLTNSSRPLTRSDDGVGSQLHYAETYRPRTFGVTGAYRY